MTRLALELGIDMHGNPRVPLPAAVAQAVGMLGLESDTKGLNLVQQVDACVTVVFGASAAAAGEMMPATAIEAMPAAVAVAYASPVVVAGHTARWRLTAELLACHVDTTRDLVFYGIQLQLTRQLLTAKFRVTRQPCVH